MPIDLQDTEREEVSFMSVDVLDNDNENIPAFYRVPSNIMMDTPAMDINDNDQFQLGFARKEIINLGVTLTHSSVAFLDLNAKSDAKWLIFGRQTPFFLKPEVAAGQPNTTSRRFGLFDDLTESKVDNEKKYNFFRGSNFIAEMTHVILSGAEVKQIIANVNENICKNHRFNLLTSNCYSASIFMLGCAIDVISKREERNQEDVMQNNSDILSIKKLLTKAAQDNFSFGVSNQALVMEYFDKVEHILKNRRLTADTFPIGGRNVNLFQKTVNTLSEAFESSIDTVAPMHTSPTLSTLKA